MRMASRALKTGGVWPSPRRQHDVAFGQIHTLRMRSCPISTSFASCCAMSGVQPAFRATKALIYRWVAHGGNTSPAPCSEAQEIRLTEG